MCSAIGLLVTAWVGAGTAPAQGYEQHFTVPHSKGTVIVVHGGSWRLVGRDQVESTRAVAESFAAKGYEVFNIDYRAGRQSVADVLNRYRQIRRTRREVCIWGDSAGGHLAMITAELAGNVTCVIDVAGPTDLPTLGGSPTRDSALASARTAFGNDLVTFSPLRHPWPKRTPLTLIYARYDPLVDISQGIRMARHSGGRLLILGKGDAGFIHSSVSQRDLDWANRVMFRRVTQAMAAAQR